MFDEMFVLDTSGNLEKPTANFSCPLSTEVILLCVEISYIKISMGRAFMATQSIQAPETSSVVSAGPTATPISRQW